MINTFGYTLRNTTSYWCHNNMLEFPNYIFSKLTQAFCKCQQKTQNDKQTYMELKNMMQKETKRVEVYYERIQKLAHGFNIPTINNFLIIVFKAGLQSYFIIATIGMKWSTLQQYKEVVMLCEKGMTTVEMRNALLVPKNIKQVVPTKT